MNVILDYDIVRFKTLDPTNIKNSLKNSKLLYRCLYIYI